MNIKIISAQLVIYSTGIVITNKLKVANAINKKKEGMIGGNVE
jgi:hypothetical protein